MFASEKQPQFDFHRGVRNFLADIEIYSSSILPGACMDQDLSIGDRVQISTPGASRRPRLAGKAGTIVGRSVYANSVSVRFDGNKTTSTFHRDYLQRIAAALEQCPP
jgi:ribosomal protein L21E